MMVRGLCVVLVVGLGTVARSTAARLGLGSRRRNARVAERGSGACIGRCCLCSRRCRQRWGSGYCCYACTRAGSGCAGGLEARCLW